MPNQNEIEKLSQTYLQAHKKLGKNCFVFISPNSQDPEIENSLVKLNKIFLKKFNKHQKSIEEFNSQVASVLEQTNPPKPSEEIQAILHPKTYNWLYSTNTYFQYRWRQGLSIFAEYGVEFFLPPMTEADKAKAAALGLEAFELQSILKIDMPYALLTKPNGEFDPQKTQEQEELTYLIKSKLSSLKRIQYAVNILTNKLIDCPEQAFFVIAHTKQLKNLAEEITLRVYDYLMHQTYNNLARGLPPTEAKENAYSQLIHLTKQKKLEEIVSFRAPSDTPMDIFVIEMLNSFKEYNEKLKPQTLKDYYPHVFDCLQKIILQGMIKPGTLLNSKIRTATAEENEQEGHQYTLEIEQILDNGEILKDIKEWYKIVLTTESLKNLLIYSTDQKQIANYHL